MFDPSRGDVERIMNRRFSDLAASNAASREWMEKLEAEKKSQNSAIESAYRATRKSGMNAEDAYAKVASEIGESDFLWDIHTDDIDGFWTV